MVDESWDVFKKLVLVEKYISDVMCENPEEDHGSPPPYPPSVDTLDLLMYLLIKTHLQFDASKSNDEGERKYFKTRNFSTSYK